MSPPALAAHAAAVTVGSISHLVYFRSGEHHLYGMRYVFFGMGIILASAFAQSYCLHLTIGAALAQTSLVVGSYLIGLYSSLVIYRVFFHPLRSFGGPYGCRISSAWFATYLAKSDAFRQLESLHHRYGDFLRIGSNDISIAHPQAVQAVHGLGSKCRKAAWYDLTHPMVSLQSTRNKTLHDQRRRVWSSAFGDRNLRDYEERMAQYRAMLIKSIDQSGGRPIDISKWFNLYTFDVMGDLAYGSSFEMLKTSKEHDAIRLLNAGLKPLAFMLPMWFFRVMTAIPGTTREWREFITYCIGQLEQRMQTKSETPDIMSSLLKPLNNQVPVGPDLAMLQGDSQLIVVAGSDTTSATLTNIFAALVQHPEHMNLLRAETDSLPRTELGNYSHSDLAHLEHLNSVINEALRLYPPVPSALQRLTPPEGLTVAGTYIPGNVTIYCPQYVIGRNPSCYSYPDSFIPGRWYSHPELIKDTSAFAPFSLGPYGCIGRPLALLNVRTTVARIIADYDVHLASDSSLREFDAARTEHFTMALPPLNLCFTKRAAAA